MWKTAPTASRIFSATGSAAKSYRFCARKIPGLFKTAARLPWHCVWMSLFLPRRRSRPWRSFGTVRGWIAPVYWRCPPALRRRVLNGFLRKCGLAEPEAIHLRQAEDLARSRRPSAWAAFPGGLRLGRQYDRLLPLHPVSVPEETALTVPGVTVAAGWEIRCTFWPEGKKWKIRRSHLSLPVIQLQPCRLRWCSAPGAPGIPCGFPGTPESAPSDDGPEDSGAASGCVTSHCHR